MLNEKIQSSNQYSQALLLISQLKRENAHLRKALKWTQKRQEELNYQLKFLTSNLYDHEKRKNKILLENQHLMEDLWTGISKRDKIISKMKHQNKASSVYWNILLDKAKEDKNVQSVLHKNINSFDFLNKEVHANKLVPVLTNMVIELSEIAINPMHKTMESSCIIKSDMFYTNATHSSQPEGKVMFESFIEDPGQFFQATP